MISAEYEPGSHHVNLNLDDKALLAYVQEPPTATALKEADPVKWLVSTIAIANHKLPSEIQDQDLMIHTILEERRMDPVVYRQTKQYLSSKGIGWISGCFG